MFMGFMNVAEIPSADGKPVLEANADKDESETN
jgi:hypothetical protein